MKIGIITLPLHVNYGGIMQAYALQTELRHLGHDVVVIDKGLIDKRISISYFYHLVRRIIAKYILGKDKIIFINSKRKKEISIEEKYTSCFVNRYIKYIKCPNLKKIKRDDFDAFIVGSDQIWRPRHYHPISNAYLDFTKYWEVKRIAYAPSFGSDNWEYSKKETIKCKKCLKKFDAVSIREKSGVELCKKKYGIVPELVLDPTFLLTSQDYISNLSLERIPKSNGKLMVYILDEDYEKNLVLDFIIKETKLKPFRTNIYQTSEIKLEDRIQPSVEKWLRGFMDASIVFTDSFHACVFSIIFHKDFFVYINEGRGKARFLSLLELFHLENRIVSSKEDVSKLRGINIDWYKVDNVLEEWKNKSLDFLETNLK